MKVIAINGSPRKKGNTYNAIQVVAKKLEEYDIETEIIHVGKKPLSGCTACGKCFLKRDLKCVLKDELVNNLIAKINEADGLILASPVYFAGVSGQIKNVLDRVFYVSAANGNFLRHKVGASLVAVRRSGGSTTFDSLNKYLNYAEMFIPSANYWNIIHGAAKGEYEQDLEGMQIMEVLGANMGYLMRVLNESTVKAPAHVEKVMMNFVR